MDYNFYTGSYFGTSIPRQDFPRLALRANAIMKRYKSIYKIIGTENDERMALCAMADTLYYHESVANGKIVQSSSVGSVSTSIATIDTSEKTQQKQLYNNLCMYMKVYRGSAYA